MRFRKTLALAAATAVAISAGSTASAQGTNIDRPLPSPSQFGSKVDNKWFPLRPGTVSIYRGVRDGKKAYEVLRVIKGTKVIEGVPCTIVKDRLYLNGALAERTTDWYAQERAGTVWYLGEATVTLDPNGHVTSRDGTWMAGVNGAQAGIYMPAHPRRGQTGRQEYLKGHAEDHFAVLSLSARVHTPAASSDEALLTKEWTPLEPGVVDHKIYVRGIGTVREQAVKGGTERLTLVSVKNR